MRSADDPATGLHLGKVAAVEGGRRVHFILGMGNGAGYRTVYEKRCAQGDRSAGIPEPQTTGTFPSDMNLTSQEMLGGRPLQQMEADHGMLCGRLILSYAQAAEPLAPVRGVFVCRMPRPDSAKSTGAFWCAAASPKRAQRLVRRWRLLQWVSPPEPLEPVWRYLGVAHRALNVLVPEPSLQRPRVMSPSHPRQNPHPA